MGGGRIDKKSEKTGIKGWKMGVGVWKLVKRCKMVKEIRWKKKRCEGWKLRKIPVKNSKKYWQNIDKMVENDEKKGIEGWKMGVRVWKLVKRYKIVKEMIWKKKKGVKDENCVKYR